MLRGRPSRMQVVGSDIAAFFGKNPVKIFTTSDLAEIFAEHRQTWNLPQGTTVPKFINFLIENTNMRLIQMESESHPNARTITKYSWGDASPLALGSDLLKGAYL